MGRWLASLALCGITVSAIAPAAVASGSKPTKAWRGSFPLYELSTTVLEYPGGKITMSFAPACTFGGIGEVAKTAARGHISGSHFTMTSATLPAKIKTPVFHLTGKIGRTSITGTASVTYAKGVDTCSFTDARFKAALLKTVPTGL